MASEKSDDRKQPGFTVSDRRGFSETGEPKPTPPAEAAPASAATDTPASSSGSADSADRAAANQPEPARTASGGRELPPVDFHTFILSLGSSALLHLGELDHPDGTASRPDLPLAKHTIDILAMLQEKTRGNLSPPEDRLIESLLYDLRLRFVERSKAPAAG